MLVFNSLRQIFLILLKFNVIKMFYFLFYSGNVLCNPIGHWRKSEREWITFFFRQSGIYGLKTIGLGRKSPSESDGGNFVHLFYYIKIVYRVSFWGQILVRPIWKVPSYFRQEILLSQSCFLEFLIQTQSIASRIKFSKNHFKFIPLKHFWTRFLNIFNFYRNI